MHVKVKDSGSNRGYHKSGQHDTANWLLRRVEKGLSWQEVCLHEQNAEEHRLSASWQIHT